MNKHHTAVWIDHNEAKVFYVQAEGFDAAVLKPHDHHVKRHPTQTAEHNHPADAKHFYENVARTIEGADEILIVGPAKTKLELIRHLHEHHPLLEKKVVGIETVDHPTDGQLAAYARTYFRAADRKLGVSP